MEAITKMPEVRMIELKEFKLSAHAPDAHYQNGGIWIKKKDGEGMLVHLADFEELIAKYYEENF